MFEEKIKKLNQENDLFYNSDGNPLAFKLGVKHLSFAKTLNYVETISNKHFRVLKEFHLINFKKKEIKNVKIGEVIELISLITYSD